MSGRIIENTITVSAFQHMIASPETWEYQSFDFSLLVNLRDNINSDYFSVPLFWAARCGYGLML